MVTRTSHLNIGSNLGDRYANIAAAVSALKAALISRGDLAAAESVVVSKAVESEPWGFTSPYSFVNVGVNISTRLTPLELLDATQEAEKAVSTASHRNPDGSYADRFVDIDIIWIEGVVINTPRLTVPHPRAGLRSFVLIPFRELNPGITL